MPEVLFTAVYRPLGNKRRKFELRIGEIGEIERLCNAGLGAIQLRLATMGWRYDDIRDSVRLGLIGGGASEAEAETLCVAYVDGRPRGACLQIANDVISACISGVPDAISKKGEWESETRAPATSPPITEPAAPSASLQ